MFEETPSILESNNKDILQLVQEILGCKDAGENCLQEWISVDDNGHQDISDEAIVSMVQSQLDDSSEDGDSEGKDTSKNIVSHSAAADVLELALRYVEQHAAVTPTDVMFMQCWCNIASSSRFSSLRQKKITDFES